MTRKTEKPGNDRWWDAWIALTIIAMISLVAIRLWVTEWTSDIYILIYLAFFAGIAGIALGYSCFSPFISGLFSVIYGLFLTGWLLGTTTEGEIAWRERIFNFIGWRLRIALEQFLAGESLTDPILFLTLLAMLLWILSFASAFILIRNGSVWPAIISLGLTLLVISHYDQNLIRNTRYLLTFLFLTLLLIGRMAFLRYRRQWHKEGILTTTETQSDYSKTLLFLTAALLLIAWLIPITPQQTSRYSDLWESLTQPWKRLTEQIPDIFIVDNPPPVPGAGYFGTSMNLGGGTPLSETIVFTVEVDSASPAGYRNYWRARSYDTYASADWSTSPGLTSIILFPDNLNLTIPEWQNAQTAAYSVTSKISPMINLFTTGSPFWVSRPVEAFFHSISDTETDLVALIADPQLISGEAYQFETMVNLPTESTLRSTSADYPDWLDRYLQLPEDLPPEVRVLAEEISKSMDNPYDIARAITRHLRINIEYTRVMPPVPPNADPIAWFLFEEKRGFCNYYATAEVLMLRAVGIPARIAVGYAEGEQDPLNDSFTIRKRDSHAWPEVYFNDYGWVVFEPTVSQPAYILPAGLESAADYTRSEGQQDIPLLDDLPEMEEDLPGALPEDNVGGLEETDGGRFFRVNSTRLIWGMIIAFLMVLALTILILVRPSFFKVDIKPLPVLLEEALIERGKNVPGWLRRWRYLAQMSSAEKAYHQLGQSIRIMGRSLNPAETPTERATMLTGFLPASAPFVEDIISEYHLDQYSNHILNEERSRNAGKQVIRLAIKTRLAQWFSIGKEQ